MKPIFSMPHPRLLLASTLFLAAQHVSAADIKVTTTAEELNNNGECSLQEAVAYLNRGITESLRDKSSDCHPEDNNPTLKILLEGEKTYQVTSEIKIQRSMTVSASNFDTLNNQNGENQPVIKTSGERIFVIDDGKASQEGVAVLLQGFRMHGPYIDTSSISSSVAASVQDEGGLIFNRERLSIDQVKLRGGAAKKGGAIYNASSDASLNIKNVEISNNFSNLGAAVFSEFANMSMQRTLVKQNRPLDASQQGFAVEIETADTPTEIAPDANNASEPFALRLSRLVTNTIFYDNDVGVMTIKPGMFVNNITAIENKTGIDFETGFDVVNPDNRQVVAAKLSNSVILNSDEYDLKVPSNDYTFVNNVVVQQNRIVDVSGNLSDIKATYQDSVNKIANIDGLIAFELDATGQKKKDVNGAYVCQPPTLDASKDKGLFCPLIQLENEYFETLKPRLLMSYTTLAQSPIVNKGKGASDSSPNPLSESCESVDVRGEKRGLCDIGAFELVIDKESTGNTKSANAEITYGETATLVLKDAVGDGQLLPDEIDPQTGKHICESYVLNKPSNPALWPSGVVGDWSEGCLLFTRTDKVPQKGTVKISESADSLIYTPSSNYHGFDKFEYQIVTTTSRFSESPNNRALKVESIVNQAPPKGLDSKTIELGYGSGSGSFDWFTLLILVSLGMSRAEYIRRKRFSVS